MRKIRVLIVLFIPITLALTSCSVNRNRVTIRVELVPTSQSSKTAVKGGNFRGTIFSQEYPFRKLYIRDSSLVQRFNPMKEDIEQAEVLLRHRIKNLNRLQPNQGDDCPIIPENIDNYFRQYVGLVDTKGNRILHMNFYWDQYIIRDKSKGYPDNRLTFESDYTLVLDGCSYYWSVDINLTTGKLLNFSVNGSA